VAKTYPFDRSMAPLRISSCAASALLIWSGYCSHRRVEPSMSVNRKVTVPAGYSVIPQRYSVARFDDHPQHVFW
jgi:hypothetical protein